MSNYLHKRIRRIRRNTCADSPARMWEIARGVFRLNCWPSSCEVFIKVITMFFFEKLLKSVDTSNSF